MNQNIMSAKCLGNLFHFFLLVNNFLIYFMISFKIYLAIFATFCGLLLMMVTIEIRISQRK